MKPIIFFFQILFSLTLFSQPNPKYKIYAIQFAAYTSYFPVTEIAVNPPTKDSVRVVYMIWLLRGDNGKNILVDAGFQRNKLSSDSAMKKYIRPDSALYPLGLKAENITDIIITHPHWDHIGGIDLFPQADLWMQKNDYSYFVGDSWQPGGTREGDSADVFKIVQANLNGKLHFVNGDSIEIIPGIRAFIGSKHTYESQFVVVNSSTDKVLIASDNIWFYYNLEHLVSIPLTFDQKAYVRQMQRMKTLVNPDLIIPGHDEQIFQKFHEVKPGVVQIR